MNSLFWVMGSTGGRLVLNVEEVATVMGLAVQTVYNRIGDGSFPIPMRKEGKRLFADARDIADYLDARRVEAREEFEAAKARMARP